MRQDLIKFTCDLCKKEEFVDERNINFMGWVFLNLGGTVKHLCGNCATAIFKTVNGKEKKRG